MKLVPGGSPDHVKSFFEALDEGFHTGNSGIGAMTRMQLDAAMANPEEFLSGLHNPPPYLLADGTEVTYPETIRVWWTDGPRFIGAMEIRKTLPSAVWAAYGGHISAGLRPSEQGRGAYKAMLAAGVRLAAEEGLERLLYICRAANTASIRGALAVGAVFMDELPIPYAPGPERLRRYIIETGGAA